MTCLLFCCGRMEGEKKPSQARWRSTGENLNSGNRLGFNSLGVFRMELDVAALVGF